ncbi:MAG: segregation/condensation protein A [Bacteroidetes bacterium]|nr:segregation/condensation protein A [Bacteroidota bacterium]
MFRVRLDKFEGPLDLLLFFIQRDELDIYDIPIADITDEFLSYVTIMEEIDLDGVGDFLYLAAMLISIKAKMLLPVPELDEEGEPIDPRTELVEKLLEYIRFKEAAAQLEQKLEDRGNEFTRVRFEADRQGIEADPDSIKDGTVFDLIRALRRVLTEAPDEPVHNVESEAYSIEEQQDYVRSALVKIERASFVELVSRRSKPFIITTFLAVLELARQGAIRIRFNRSTDDFSVEKTDLLHQVYVTDVNQRNEEGSESEPRSETEDATEKL